MPRSYDEIVSEIGALILEADNALAIEDGSPPRGEGEILTHWAIIGSFTDFAQESGARGSQVIHMSNGGLNNWMMIGLLRAASVNLEAQEEDREK